MILYLIRHCHVRNPRNLLYGRLPGFPLSLRGRAAAKRVGRFLKAKKIEIIFSSPLQRTLETAEFIQQKIGLETSLETRTELLEGDLHILDGLSVKIIHQKLAEEHYGEYLGVNKRTYEGENLPEMGERIKNFVLSLVKEKRFKNVALVSHRDPLLSAIWQLREKPLRNFHEKDLPRGGVWKLVFKKEKLKSARLIYSPE